MKRVEAEPIVVLERSGLAATEKKRIGNSVTTSGLMMSGQLRTLKCNMNAVFSCKEDRVVQSERAGI